MEHQGNAELLATLIGNGQFTEGSLAQAQALLRRHGSLRGLFSAALEQGEVAEKEMRQLAAAAELCRRRLLEQLSRGTALTSPAETTEYLKAWLRDRRRETFTVLFLDTRHRVISAEELFRGSIDGACVYPRVVAERALALGAAAVIVAHNHPSGVAEPSLADQAITHRLKEALGLLEIRLLDHFIVGDGVPVSMAGRGML